MGGMLGDARCVDNGSYPVLRISSNQTNGRMEAGLSVTLSRQSSLLTLDPKLLGPPTKGLLISGNLQVSLAKTFCQEDFQSWSLKDLREQARPLFGGFQTFAVLWGSHSKH